MIRQQEYDLAIVGAGFAGLTAAKLAFERKLNFCLIAKHFGATAHFSGAFDFCRMDVDAILAKKSDSFSWQKALQKFLSKHPKHLYAQLAEKNSSFVKNVLLQMQEILRFYQIDFIGDEDSPVLAFGASGQPKLTALAMAPQGISLSQWNHVEEIFVLDIPFVSDYPVATIVKTLKKYVSQVHVLKWQEAPVNRTSPLASLNQAMDAQPEGLQQLQELFKKQAHPSSLILFPPILGVKNSLENFQKLKKDVSGHVVEMLSQLPSLSGLRLQEKVKKTFKEKSIEWIPSQVSSLKTSDKKVLSCHFKQESQEQEIHFHELILATGKFIGGGIQHDGHFKESLLDLPLAVNKTFLSPQTHVTQLLHKEALAKQPFLQIGVQVDAKGHPVFQNQVAFENLKACGQLMTGFDWTREHCGFGMSVATAMKCF